ncbi:MAG: hypothetical protein ACRYG4_04225 [Janthinobacterium lividum]
MTPAFPPLEHYSFAPVGRIEDRDQWDHFMKPLGFWVSVPGRDDWPAFCRDLGFHHRLLLRYQVQLVPTANILWLQSPSDIEGFTAQYGIDFQGIGSIEWGRVAQDYDGILIAPFQWRRLYHLPEMSWYYSWDCASGCIWSASAVASIELLPPVVFLEPVEGEAHAN